MESMNTELKAYSGYFLDREQLLQSSSGGLATAISEKIIKSGGCVFGVTYADDFKSAHYMCAEKLTDLVKLKGSKYIQADKIMGAGGGTPYTQQ